MKAENIFTIKNNERLTKDIFRMTFEGTIKAIPGQFINIQIPNLYLRRPISIFDVRERDFSVIYKVVGEGTEIMSLMKEGEKLNLLYSLGSGYTIFGKKPLLVGGGCGIPPLYFLAKELLNTGCEPIIIMGFNSDKEIFCKEEFEKLGINTIITTVDGSYGIKGFVTDAVNKIDYDYVYSCGPIPMLKAVFDKTECEGQYSFEERMGCGFGACMGCSCKTKEGFKRICTDGPVLKSNEIIWEEVIK